MSKLRLSFIILTWNSERFIERCLTSILTKCRGEELSFEALIVDNGSEDKTLGIVKEYQKNYPESFILISLEINKGTTYPRNLALKIARGDFLCVIDSDTELGEGSLNDMLQRLELDM